jgi:hypothetical protein
MGFNPSHARQKSRPSSGYRRSGNRSSRGRESRDILSLEIPRVNQDRPSGRTRGSNRSHQGKSRQEVVHRHYSHRDIGDPGDKKFGHFGFAKSKTPTRRRKAPLCGGQLSTWRRIGIRGIDNPWENVFDI